MATKNDSSTIRMKAPIVGSHLPLSSDRIAPHTAIQMNRTANSHLPTPCSGVKNSLNTDTEVIVSEPPSQIGFDAQ